MYNITHYIFYHSRREQGIYMRQSVTLTGLGIQSFQAAVDGIIAIHSIFSRQFPHGTLEPWQPSWFLDHHTITASNRYFSEKRLCPCLIPIPFPMNVDPKGILNTMMGEKLIHAEENEVKYYEALVDQPSTYRP